MEEFYRRRLPHWRESEATYFVTWRLVQGQDELSSDEPELVLSALKRFDGVRYQLNAYVVMNDHVHNLLTPLGSYRLRDILHSWKSFTARQMQRTHHRIGQVWQHEYFDRIIRDEKEFEQKLQYILRNPWKLWPELTRYARLWPPNE